MMDLLKTPSVQSLLDSDLESVESLQYLDLDIEEVNLINNLFLYTVVTFMHLTAKVLKATI